MTKLCFEKSTVDFESITNSLDIELLEIAFCNLTTLHGIERLQRLNVLRIHYCRSLVDISAISKLTQL